MKARVPQWNADRDEAVLADLAVWNDALLGDGPVPPRGWWFTVPSMIAHALLRGWVEPVLVVGTTDPDDIRATEAGWELSPSGQRAVDRVERAMARQEVGDATE